VPARRSSGPTAAMAVLHPCIARPRLPSSPSASMRPRGLPSQACAGVHVLDRLAEGKIFKRAPRRRVSAWSGPEYRPSEVSSCRYSLALAYRSERMRWCTGVRMVLGEPEATALVLALVLVLGMIAR
jgi:hypothetical protein